MRPDTVFPSSSQRRDYIRNVFHRVADRYDLMNDLMSLGLHRLWKQVMVERLLPRQGASGVREILDMASGSGDIALRCFARAPQSTSVTLCDSSMDMLYQARGRINALSAQAPVDGRLRLLCAEAEQLPFPSRSFDAYTIAFGIRNATSIEVALKEAVRVLRHGGRFLCLEFSQPHLPGLEQAYRAYGRHAIPVLGRIVVGDDAPYRYLVESIHRFPSLLRFETMMRESGLSRISRERLSGGIVTLHRGWRI